MAPLLLVLPFGPLLAWKRADIVAAAQRLIGAAALAIFAAILISALGGATISLAPIGLLLGFWVAFGAIAELVDRSKLGRIPLGESARRLIGLPRTAWSTAIAHFGIGITVLGIVATTAWETELVTTLNPGESAELSGYIVAFDSFDAVQGPNYVSDEGRFTVTAPGGETRQMLADRRTYVASGMPTTEAAIETYGFSQLYLQLGEPLDDTHVVRIWHKPYITLIWLGAVLMAFAGVLSLTDRKLRVGAPRRAAKTAPQAAQ
jgi:cytochrome c-type biogenesis protein CcmF